MQAIINKNNSAILSSCIVRSWLYLWGINVIFSFLVLRWPRRRSFKTKQMTFIHASSDGQCLRMELKYRVSHGKRSLWSSLHLLTVCHLHYFLLIPSLTSLHCLHFQGSLNNEHLPINDIALSILKVFKCLIVVDSSST